MMDVAADSTVSSPPTVTPPRMRTAPAAARPDRLSPAKTIRRHPGHHRLQHVNQRRAGRSGVLLRPSLDGKSQSRRQEALLSVWRRPPAGRHSHGGVSTHQNSARDNTAAVPTCITDKNSKLMLLGEVAQCDNVGGETEGAQKRQQIAPADRSDGAFEASSNPGRPWPPAPPPLRKPGVCSYRRARPAKVPSRTPGP